MDFQLTDEQRLLKQTVRQLAEEKLRPRAAHWDRTDEFPYENIPILREAGLIGMMLPSEYGGGDASLVDFVLVMEEIARACVASSFLVGCQSGLAAKAILDYGTEEHRQRYLPKIATGEMLLAWGMTEPGAGSDIGSLQTSAQERNGECVLNGQKIFISLAHAAHLFLVIARFEKIPGLDGLGAVLVPRDAPGLRLGRKIKTLGIRGTGMGELFFDDCVVPAENVLLGAGGFRKILTIMSNDRIAGNPPVSVGIAQAALDAAIAYLGQREQFGRKLAEFQGLRWKLADMAIKVDTARLLVYRAAANAAQGSPSILEASIAKTFANEAAISVTSDALQIHGAYGYTDELPIEKMFRDARGLAIGDGTVEVQRNLIASQLLRR